MPGLTLTLNATVTIDVNKTVQLGEVGPFVTLVDNSSTRNWTRTTVNEVSGTVSMNGAGKVYSMGPIVVKSGSATLGGSGAGTFSATSLTIDSNAFASYQSIVTLNDGTVRFTGDIYNRSGKLVVSATKGNILRDLCSGALASRIILEQFGNYKVWMDLNVSDPNTTGAIPGVSQYKPIDINQPIIVAGDKAASAGNTIYLNRTEANSLVRLNNLTLRDGAVFTWKFGGTGTTGRTNLLLDGNAWISRGSGADFNLMEVKPSDPNSGAAALLNIGKANFGDPNNNKYADVFTNVVVSGAIRNGVTVNLSNGSLEMPVTGAGLIESNVLVLNRGNQYNNGSSQIIFRGGYDGNAATFAAPAQTITGGISPGVAKGYVMDANTGLRIVNNVNHSITVVKTDPNSLADAVLAADRQGAANALPGVVRFTNVQLDPNTRVEVQVNNNERCVADLTLNGSAGVSANNGTYAYVCTVTGNTSDPNGYVLTTMGTNDIRFIGTLSNVDLVSAVGGKVAWLTTQTGVLGPGNKFDLNGGTITMANNAGLNLDVDPGAGTIDATSSFTGTDMGVRFMFNSNGDPNYQNWGSGLTVNLGGNRAIFGYVYETGDANASAQIIAQYGAKIVLGPGATGWIRSERSVDLTYDGIAWFTNVNLGEGSKLTLARSNSTELVDLFLDGNAQADVPSTGGSTQMIGNVTVKDSNSTALLTVSGTNRVTLVGTLSNADVLITNTNTDLRLSNANPVGQPGSTIPGRSFSLGGRTVTINTPGTVNMLVDPGAGTIVGVRGLLGMGVTLGDPNFGPRFSLGDGFRIQGDANQLPSLNATNLLAYNRAVIGHTVMPDPNTSLFDANAEPQGLTNGSVFFALGNGAWWNGVGAFTVDATTTPYFGIANNGNNGWQGSIVLNTPPEFRALEAGTYLALESLISSVGKQDITITRTWSDDNTRVEFRNNGNTFSGDMYIDGGLLFNFNGNDGAFGDPNNNVYVRNGGVLRFGSATMTLGGLRKVDIDANGGTIRTDGGTITFAAPSQLSASGVLTKDGAGTLAISASNPGVTGPIVVKAGGLLLLDANALPNATGATVTIPNATSILFNGTPASLPNYGSLVVSPSLVGPLGDPNNIRTGDGGAFGYTESTTLSSLPVRFNDFPTALSTLYAAATADANGVVTQPAGVPTYLLHLGGPGSSGTWKLDFPITDAMDANGNPVPVAVVLDADTTYPTEMTQLDLRGGTVPRAPSTYSGGTAVPHGIIWVDDPNQIGAWNRGIGFNPGAIIAITPPSDFDPNNPHMTYPYVIKLIGGTKDDANDKPPRPLEPNVPPPPECGPYGSVLFVADANFTVNWNGLIDSSINPKSVLCKEGPGTLVLSMPVPTVASIINSWGLRVSDGNTEINVLPYAGWCQNGPMVFDGGNLTLRFDPNVLLLDPNKYGFCGMRVKDGRISWFFMDSNVLFQASGLENFAITGSLIIRGADDSAVFRIKSSSTGAGQTGAGTIDLRGGTFTFGDGTTPCLPVDSNFTLKLNGGLFQAIGSSMHDLNGHLVVNDANTNGYARVTGGWTVKDGGGTSWSGTLEKLAGTLNLNRDGGAVSVTPGALLRISGGIFNVGGAIDPFTDAADPNLHVAVQNSATFNVNTGSKHVGEVSGTGTTNVADGASLTVGSQGDLTQGGLTMGAGVGSTVTVHGSATIGSGVTVPGVSVLTVDGNLSVGGNFTVEGTASVGGLTRVAGSTTLGFSSVPTLNDVETSVFLNNAPGVSLGGIRPYDANISSSTAVNADMTVSHVRHDSLKVGESITQVTLTIRQSDPNYPLAGVSQVRSLDLYIDPGNPNDPGDANYVTSTVDLTNNALIVKYSGASSPLNDITAMVRVARGDGSWRDPNYTNGLTPGINSSTFDSNYIPDYQSVGVFDNSVDQSYTEFPVGGLPVDANVVIVKVTWGGDTDLDGDVTGLDYGRIDYAFVYNNPESGPPPDVLLTGWQNGDFDYDGAITGLDYGIIDFMYSTLYPEGGGVSGAAGAVPEPTTMGLLGLGLIALLSRRRRSA
jgi:hypothetical protein